MSWPYELQEKSVKFLLESSMGMHSCCAICLCHISGRRGFIHFRNASEHKWIIEIEEDSGLQIHFESVMKIVESGWIVEGV
ncbi:MAG: hypothetical protein N3A69_01720 [Leptospiraceae bacterium]|nr:hypothetical protein [Leptospiraceae bacterium]